MVEVTIRGCGQFESAEADVIKCFIVYTIGFICVLYQLMHRQSSIVWLHNCIRNLKVYQEKHNKLLCAVPVQNEACTLFLVFLDVANFENKCEHVKHWQTLPATELYTQMMEKEYMNAINSYDS